MGKTYWNWTLRTKWKAKSIFTPNSCYIDFRNISFFRILIKIFNNILSGSRHMLLGLGTVWLRPKRAGARAFCAHERAGAHTSVRVSERVSARVRA